MSIHMNKLSATAIAGIDSDINEYNRDPLEINRNIQVSWQTVIGEPEGLQSPVWIWKFSSLRFSAVQNCTYKFLSILLSPLLALILGVNFAFLAFLQIWHGRPILKFFYVIFYFIKSFLEMFLGSTIGPLCQAIVKRDDVIALSWVFGNTIEHALELVDRELVSVLKSPSNKLIINVRGSEETYWIPPGAAVCQCQSYIHGLKPICKHIIAAHFVLSSLCRSEYYSISDAELTHQYKKFFKDCNL